MLTPLIIFGDLAPRNEAASTDISFTRPGFSVFASKRYGKRFALRGTFSWGRLRGDDAESANPDDPDKAPRFRRNQRFRNDIKELSVVGMFDLYDNPNLHKYRLQFTPYAFGGVSFFHHNPKGLIPEINCDGDPVPNAGDWVALQPLGTEGQNSDNYDIDPYARIQFAVPVGLGVRYKISRFLDAAFEIGYRFTFTDYLDDVGGVYANAADLESDIVRALADQTNLGVTSQTTACRQPGTERAHGDNDVFVITSIQLMWVINPKPRHQR